MSERVSQDQSVVSTPTIASSNAVCFLGLTLHPKTLIELNELVAQGIRERRKWIIANHNLHSVYLFHNPAAVARVLCGSRVDPY